MKKVKILSLLLAFVMLLSAFIIPAAADTVQAPEVLGASIRTEGDQGLRFVGRIKKNNALVTDGSDNVNFGFLIIPESMTDGSAITVSTTSVKQVKAKRLMGKDAVEAVGLTYDANYYYFSVVQLGMPENFYGVNMVVKAYVNNSGTYTYSNTPDYEKRSIQFVAQAIKDLGGEIPAFVTTVLTKYEQQGADIIVADVAHWFNASSGSYATSALQNTYARLNTAKTLNVAYIGGSVTVGVGLEGSYTAAKDSWRALTTSWLKTTYPNATITETNAGIGGTGSSFGAYRAIDDLKLKDEAKKPDLLFIDFAINDQYDGITTAEVKQYMETLIRTVYTYAPYCDIIIIYVTDKTRLNYTDASHYPTLAAQHEVATKYGLTEIYVGKMLVEEVGLTASNWNNTYFGGEGAENPSDIVHPNSKGYKKYAGYVQNVLSTELTKSLNPYGYVKHEILSASYSPISNPARYFFNDSKDKTTGFDLIEKPTSLADKGYLKASVAGVTGAKVSFTFTGTGLQLWTYARAQASTIKVTIDGTSTNYSITRSSDGNKPYRVASGLTNTTHTVTIEQTTAPASGNLLTLQALMVEGDPNFTGVTFINVN